MDILEQNEPDRSTPEASRRATAVALRKYGISDSVIPKIVAAGYGKLAEQILQLAFDNGVKVREDRVLAEMLATIELDSDIPSEALIAVAEILSHVYKADANYVPPPLSQDPL